MSGSLTGGVRKVVWQIVPPQPPESDCLGVLAVGGDRPGQFDEQKQHVLRLFATCTAIALTLDELENEARNHLVPLLASHLPAGPLSNAREALHTAKNIVRDVITHIERIKDQLSASPGANARLKDMDAKREQLLAMGDVLQAMFDRLPAGKAPAVSATATESADLQKAYEQALRRVPFTRDIALVSFTSGLGKGESLRVRGSRMEWLLIFYTL